MSVKSVQLDRTHFDFPVYIVTLHKLSPSAYRRMLVAPVGRVFTVQCEHRVYRGTLWGRKVVYQPTPRGRGSVQLWLRQLPLRGTRRV